MRGLVSTIYVRPHIGKHGNGWNEYCSKHRTPAFSLQRANRVLEVKKVRLLTSGS